MINLDEHNELKNRETHIDYAKYAGKVSEETTEKNEFTTEKEVVSAKNTTENSSDSTEKILSAIKDNPYITTKELALKFNITEDGVFYHVKKLRLSGRIKRSGGRKNGYWDIV